MPQRPPQQGLLRLPHVGHPSTAESFIPVWGSGREAIADFQDGDYVGAGLNAAMAASDLFIPGAIVKAGAKAGAKGLVYTVKNAGPDSYAWKNVRAGLGHRRAQLFEKDAQVHHMIEKKGPLGNRMSDKIKNQPWNLKTLPPGEKGREIHGRIHGNYKGKPQFNPAVRAYHGTTAWAKATAAGAVGKPIGAAKAEADKRKKR